MTEAQRATKFLMLSSIVALTVLIAIALSLVDGPVRGIRSAAEIVASERRLVVPAALESAVNAVEGLVISFLIALLLRAASTGERLRSIVGSGPIVLNVLPLAAILPILTLASDAGHLAVVIAVLAAIPVIWPTVDAWWTAANQLLQDGPAGLLRVGSVKRVAILGPATARGALPQAIRVGGPIAFFGATVAGFAGAPRGLGVYLAVGMWQGRIDKIAVAALAAMVVSLAFYTVASALERASVGSFRVTDDSARGGRTAKAIILSVGSRAIAAALASVFFWYCLSLAIDSDIIAPFPHIVLERIVHSGLSGDLEASAVLETAVTSISGAILGTLAAVVLAIAIHVWRFLRLLIYPVVLVSQSVPLTVFVSTFVVLLGRGAQTSMVFAISVSFFAAFVIIRGGLDRAAIQYRNLERIFRPAKSVLLVEVLLPASRKYFGTALAVSVPRAISGVLLCEYLATRTGLGAFIYTARGGVDFTSLWVVTWIAIAMGLLFDSVASTLGGINSEILWNRR